MDDPFGDEPLEKARWRRYLVPGLVIIGLLAGGAVLISKVSSGGTEMSRRDAITMVSLPPPPSPPPPPPPTANTPPPTEAQQRIEQPMIKEEQAKAEPPKDEPPLGTGIKGSGPDSYGLGGQAGNGRIGGTAGNGSQWGWYANQVQGQVVQAMQRNRKTHSAKLNVTVKVWPDRSGRVARAQMGGSTGDPALDSAIRDEILNGLQLQPPPPGMPMPITLRLAARRP
jgi:TonB family protein